jgi:uncharacterized phiE125 gp8 family phage protein
MPLVMTSGPATEPLTLAEAKAHLRIDDDDEDQLIASLILTSRLHVEAALGLALLTQSWRLVLDRWPKSAVVVVPLQPLQSVAQVRVLAADGNPSVVPAADYVVDVASMPGRIVRTGSAYPTPGRAAGGIEIDFTAGYGALAASVPAPIRQALLLLVAHWYEHRDPIEIGAPGTAIPDAVARLLAPFRRHRL